MDKDKVFEVLGYVIVGLTYCFIIYVSFFSDEPSLKVIAKFLGIIIPSLMH